MITLRMLDIETRTLTEAGHNRQELRILGLGNQRLFTGMPARDLYRELGCMQHMSIDLNGEDGSLPYDLTKPLPEDLVGQFNLITNYGTSEHVNDQYMVFKNIHDACCTQGLMMHWLVCPGHWEGHCRYYYPAIFKTGLAARQGYWLMAWRTISPFGSYGPHRGKAEKHDCHFVCFRKADSNAFISREVFEELDIVDTGDMSRTGVY